MLCIKASMSGKMGPYETQKEIVVALKGLCGAPRSEEEIRVSIFAGQVAFTWQNHMESQLKQIRPRLEGCQSLNPETIVIAEPTTLYH